MFGPPWPKHPMVGASVDNTNCPFAGLFRTGATGLEPATSGVTGLFHDHDDWRRSTRNRAIHAVLGPLAFWFVTVEQV